MTVPFEGAQKNDGGAHVKSNLVYTEANRYFFIGIIRTAKGGKRPKFISFEASFGGEQESILNASQRML